LHLPATPSHNKAHPLSHYTTIKEAGAMDSDFKQMLLLKIPAKQSIVTKGEARIDSRAIENERSVFLCNVYALHGLYAFTLV